MTNALVPKVTLSESTQAVGVPQGNQVVIGIIGVSASGTANVVQKVLSVSQAEDLFGSNTAYGADLLKMIKKAFQEGASVIKALSIGTPDLDSATSASQGALTADASAGVSAVEVADASIYSNGDIVYLGTGTTYDKEERLVVSTGVSTTLTFTTPLQFTHYTGELAKIVTPKTSSNYSTGITAMLDDEDKSIVICDLNDDNTSALIKTMCDSSALANSPCVFIRSANFGEGASDVVTNAASHNSNRVIQLFPLLTDFNGKSLSPGETAAVVAGRIAFNGVPKTNHNFTSFTSVGGVLSKISDYDVLIAGGVTPLEMRYNEVRLVRFVTTQTTVDSIPSTTWQEGAVRLNVDFIERVLSRDVQLKFLQKGQNAQTRLALKQEVQAYLDQFAASSILVADPDRNIPAFREPVVSVDADDTTSVSVEIEISPGKPLNFVNLKFKIII